MRLLWLLLLLCVAVVRSVKSYAHSFTFVAFVVCVSVSYFDWHRFIWFRITFESIVNNNNNTKNEKKIRTNELNKRRGPYFYRSMLCCDQIDGSLCDVFYFIHTFLVFCFSSFEFNVRHPIAANYLVLHTSICTFNHKFLSFHLTKFSYTISWFLFTQ